MKLIGPIAKEVYRLLEKPEGWTANYASICLRKDPSVEVFGSEIFWLSMWEAYGHTEHHDFTILERIYLWRRWRKVFDFAHTNKDGFVEKLKKL